MNRLSGVVQNKKILLIGPVYFGYEKSIISTLEETGAEVPVVERCVSDPSGSQCGGDHQRGRKACTLRWRIC